MYKQDFHFFASSEPAQVLYSQELADSREFTGCGGMLGRKNSLAGRDRELPVQEEVDAHTFPTNVGVVGDAWGILAPTNSFALLSTRPF